MEGKKLKNAIAGSGLTQEVAANKLGIARQTLTNWMNRGLLDEDIIQNVKTKLGIDLYSESPTKVEPNTTEGLYQKLLSEKDNVIREKDRVIKLMEEKISRLEGRFSDVPEKPEDQKYG